MQFNLLDVVFLLPTAAPPHHEDALDAIVGVSTATGLPLNQTPAASERFCENTLADPGHTVCVIDTLARVAVSRDAKNHPSGVFV